MFNKFHVSIDIRRFSMYNKLNIQGGLTMKLGDLIKEYRKLHCLSQRQFAINCGVSNGYVSMLERGANPKTGKPVIPNVYQIKKLADGMGMSITDVLEIADDMPIDLVTEADLLSAAKKSAPTDESGRNDPVDIELASLILQLSPEKKKDALKFLRYLADRVDD